MSTECPFLGGQIGKAYAQGFQTGKGEDGGKYLLGVITLKHWAGYNVERNRGGYDDNVSRFDLLDSYLPAFRAAVTEGHAAGVMCSCKSSDIAESRLRICGRSQRYPCAQTTFARIYSPPLPPLPMRC